MRANLPANHPWHRVVDIDLLPRSETIDHDAIADEKGEEEREADGVEEEDADVLKDTAAFAGLVLFRGGWFVGEEGGEEEVEELVEEGDGVLFGDWSGK